MTVVDSVTVFLCFSVCLYISNSPSFFLSISVENFIHCLFNCTYYISRIWLDIVFVLTREKGYKRTKRIEILLKGGCLKDLCSIYQSFNSWFSKIGLIRGAKNWEQEWLKEEFQNGVLGLVQQSMENWNRHVHLKTSNPLHF